MNNIEIIKNDKFKGVYISINYLLPIRKEEVANNLVWATSLSKMNKKYSSQRELELRLAELYNSTYGVSVEKIGDLYNIEFRLECLNSKYLPKNEEIFKEVIDVFLTLLYEPKSQNNKFDDKIIERQKKYFINILEKQKDDSRSYASNKIMELLEKGEISSMNTYTDIDSINKVDAESAYHYYEKLLNEAEVKVIITGNLEDTMIEVIKDKIKFKENKYNIVDSKKTNSKVNVLTEKASLSQSILAIGFKIENYNIEDAYKYMVLNHILGQGSNSKLFLNIREKNSMAYYIFSSFKKIKGEMIVLTGINKNNKENVEKLIYDEIVNMSKGNISDTEVDIAKKSLIMSIKQLEEEISLIAKKSLYNNLIYGEDTSTEEMIKEIEKVKIEEISRLYKNIKAKAVYFYEGE